MVEATYLSLLIAGFGGGAVRGLVGFVKHQYSYKNVSFKLPYFLGMMFISGTIGIVTAVAVKELGLMFFNLEQLSPAVIFVVGYAGGDFLENIYKTIIRKPSLYSFPENLIKK